MLQLSTPVTTLRMIGPTFANRLKRLGIATIGDLLYHIPFRYEDFSIVSKINLLQAGEKVTVVGTVISMKNIYTRNGKKIQKGIITDETGEIEAIWYNQPFLTKILLPNMRITLAGEVNLFGNKLVFESPDFEIIKPDTSLVHTGRLVSVYPETANVSSKWLRSRIASILYKFSPEIEEFLPPDIVKNFNLLGEKEAVYKVHFPQSYKEAEEAKRRLSFDELLTFELMAQIRRKNWEIKKVGRKFLISPFVDKIQSFINNLPFKLTNAQKKAAKEILADLSKETPMNRLLEGDVGSGKTVVASIAIYAAYLNGCQSILMAPTEILAHQHFQTIERLLTPYKIKVGLLTATNKIKDGENFSVVIGTHALITDKKFIKNLGLVIIDEQQRFGVQQRSKLREKGDNPHLLSMTATPIPRTIALTLYADLDLSVIDEMPKGRVRVKTWVVPPEKRSAAYNWIRQQIINSNHREQAFIICPLIEQSETLISVKAAKVEFQNLQTEIFPDLSLGLLHGKLTEKEKNATLEKFAKNKLDILIATPVVEVGIDIPQATIMMIEGADRFGLSQLHQLRGRVGRSATQSYCLLFTESLSEKTLARLKLLEREYSGPKLADLDFTLRGPGEIYGTRQHGAFGLKIANLSDLSSVEQSKKAVKLLMESDSSLSSFPLLRQRLQKYTIQDIAPD